MHAKPLVKGVLKQIAISGQRLHKILVWKQSTSKQFLLYINAPNENSTSSSIYNNQRFHLLIMTVQLYYQTFYENKNLLLPATNTAFRYCLPLLIIAIAIFAKYIYIIYFSLLFTATYYCYRYLRQIYLYNLLYKIQKKR